MKCTSVVTSTIVRVVFASLLAMAVGSLSANAQSFTLTGSLNTARVAHTATLLNNAIVLIAGGVGSNGGSLAAAELYNPAAGISTLTGSLNTARVAHTATLLNNGIVLIAGGVGVSGYLADAELYNPAVVSLSAASLTFDPQNFGTTSAPGTETVTNTGTG